MKIRVNEQPVIVFSSPIRGYAEECLKRHNTGHFQPPIYFAALFSFATELKSLTHNDMSIQMEAVHGQLFLAKIL
jgi:hypothetical protein